MTVGWAIDRDGGDVMRRSGFSFNGVYYAIRTISDGKGWIWGLSNATAASEVRWNEHVPFESEADAIADAVRKIVQRAEKAE